MTNRAIAYDQVKVMGGGEKVAFEAARALNCPIYTFEKNEDIIPDDVEVIDLSGRVGKRIMGMHYHFKDIYHMSQWQHVPALHDVDTVIELKTNTYWYVPQDTQTVVRYTHSTPRNLYDQFHRRGGDLTGDVLKTMQRMLYQQVVPYADAWIANSHLVASRINQYFGIRDREIATIHPPVETSAFSPGDAETQEYLFSVGRLAVNKRIGLLREIAEHTDEKIVVAGTGPKKETLTETPMPDNLEYLGYISEAEKQRRLSEATATLFLAENEDFGIVPIESMAAGTPVIGVDEGYTRYQIQHLKNGLLVDPTVESVTTAIRGMHGHGVRWSEEQIAAFASQFNTERFHEELLETIQTAEKQATVSTEFDYPFPEAEL